MKSVFVLWCCMLALPLCAAQSAKKHVGLCLSGGGAKGAYEIGVWKALDEYGITEQVGAVAGTSVGALNAALFVNVPQAEAERLWRDDIGYFEILTPDIDKLAFSAEAIAVFVQQIRLTYEMYTSMAAFDASQHPFLQTVANAGADSGKVARDYLWKLLASSDHAPGVFSREKLAQIIEANTTLEQFQTSKVKVYATTLRKQGLVAKAGTNRFAPTDFSSYFLLNEQLTMVDVRDILLASSAIPVAFDSQLIGATAVENGAPVGMPYEYVDGGFEACGGRNTPLKPLLSDDALDTLIVVYLMSDDELGGNYVSASAEYRAGLRGKTVIEIVPSQPLGNLIHGTLNFSAEQISALIDLGYADTVKRLQISPF